MKLPPPQNKLSKSLAEGTGFPFDVWMRGIQLSCNNTHPDICWVYPRDKIIGHGYNSVRGEL